MRRHTVKELRDWLSVLDGDCIIHIDGMDKINLPPVIGNYVNIEVADCEDEEEGEDE